MMIEEDWEVPVYKPPDKDVKGQATLVIVPKRKELDITNEPEDYSEGLQFKPSPGYDIHFSVEDIFKMRFDKAIGTVKGFNLVAETLYSAENQIMMIFDAMPLTDILPLRIEKKTSSIVNIHLSKGRRSLRLDISSDASNTLVYKYIDGKIVGDPEINGTVRGINWLFG